MRLTAEAVDAIVEACLFEPGEPRESQVEVEAVVHTYHFHPGRIAAHTAEISALLAELPVAFRAGEPGGGGWTFLNACDDRHGRQWTGLHIKVEALFALGIAVGKARWLMPREMWDVLPGGMPYVAVEL